MAVFHYDDQEVTGKIVFYGVPGAGKATSLRALYERVDEEARSKLVTASTDQGARMSFDFLPLNVGEMTGIKIRFRLVTAPGENVTPAGWKRVLQGADAVVFVVDSAASALAANHKALSQLKELAASCQLPLPGLPLVLQLNKRDSADALSIEELNRHLNPWRVPWFATVAVRGEGVLECFQTLGRMLLVEFGRRYKEEVARRRRELIQRAREEAGVAAADSEEETRTIQVGADEADDEAPTRVVSEPELETVTPQPAGISEESPIDVAPSAATEVVPVERSEKEEVPTGLEQLHREVQEVAEQALVLLENQSRLLRRVEELRRRLTDWSFRSRE